MTDRSSKNDPYQLHRMALSPLLPNATKDDTANACKQIATIGEDVFAGFLLQQGLAPMWDKLLKDSESARQLSEEFKSTLHQARLHAAGSYLIHHHNLSLIRKILEQATIPHLVYKGADIRERLYDEPALRPAVDIDLLVPDNQKFAAIKAFKQRDFEFHMSETIISHEANLYKGNTSIDLHWDILRPGRTRTPMAPALLASRIDYGSHWGMCNEATLFIMLVHPVFAKYSTAPQASLMRTVDLAKLLARADINWQEVMRLLNDAGLKTAAWITLKWHELLTGLKPPTQFMSTIQPGKLRQKYLSYWLQRNLSSQLLEKPLYVQLGFTLPAHDQCTDAIRAVRRASELKQSQAADINTMLQQIQT